MHTYLPWLQEELQVEPQKNKSESLFEEIIPLTFSSDEVVFSQINNDGAVLTILPTSPNFQIDYFINQLQLYEVEIVYPTGTTKMLARLHDYHVTIGCDARTAELTFVEVIK